LSQVHKFVSSARRCRDIYLACRLWPLILLGAHNKGKIVGHGSVLKIHKN